MKKILLFGLLAGLLNACSKENIPLYDSQHYVQFVNDYTDSMEISFFFYGSAQIEIPLPVKLVGMPLTEAKEIVLKANSQYTTASSSQFALPDKALFKAGQTMDTLYITLKREGLNQKVRLVVDIADGTEILRAFIPDKLYGSARRYPVRDGGTVTWKMFSWENIPYLNSRN